MGDTGRQARAEIRCRRIGGAFGRAVRARHNYANTLLLWVSFFCALGVHGLLLNWLPSLLVAGGIGKADAGLIQILFNVAGGYRKHSSSAGRWWHSVRASSSLCAFAGLAVALGIIAQASSSLGFMTLAGGLVGLGSMGVQGIVYGLAPKLYPANVRGTGVGAAMAVGRFGSVVGPVFAGILVAAGGGGFGVFMGVLPIVVVSGIATLTLMNRKERLAA